MVAKNLFRARHTMYDSNNPLADVKPPSTKRAATPCEQKLKDYEEQLAHLSQQKELHTLALKEMYQFLCKLDTSFKEENQKLRDLIEIEQSRSAKLIEVTRGLWDIIELMDDGNPRPVDLTEELSREMEELQAIDVEITDESDAVLPGSKKFPHIDEIAPMMAAMG